MGDESRLAARKCRKRAAVLPTYGTCAVYIDCRLRSMFYISPETCIGHTSTISDVSRGRGLGLSRRRLSSRRAVPGPKGARVGVHVVLTPQVARGPSAPVRAPSDLVHVRRLRPEYLHVLQPEKEVQMVVHRHHDRQILNQW